MRFIGIADALRTQAPGIIKRMPTLLFYDDPARPHPEAFAHLGQALACTGVQASLEAPIKAVGSQAELVEALRAHPHAALVFAATLDTADALSAAWRTLCPTLACVALIEAPPDAPLPTPVPQTDFLRLPFAPLDACTRMAAALRLSASLCAQSEQVDAVTGLYHQRPFMARLQEEISLARRHLSPFACLTLAIDGFAMYRDSYGYELSQALLAHVAQVIRQRKRQEDIAALVGDGEIALLLPRSSEKGCKPLLVRVLQSLQATPFCATLPDGTPVDEPLDLHVGVVAYPMADADAPALGDVLAADTLLRYARHALHLARQQEADEPADRIVCFSDIRPAIG